MKYRPRWRADATGFVAPFAGQWAGPATDDRAHLESIRAAMVNGAQVEIVEVEG